MFMSLCSCFRPQIELKIEITNKMNEIPRTVKLGCRNLLSQNVVEMDLLYIYYYAFP